MQTTPELVAHQKTKKLQILHPDATQEEIIQIFARYGQISNVESKDDRWVVTFQDASSVHMALQENGRLLRDKQFVVESTQEIVHIFVGDIGHDVTDEVLARHFGHMKSFSEARVMWDYATGKSRGYGFVGFRDRTDAEEAIREMNGKKIGQRTVRCNWAAPKQRAPEKMRQSSVEEIAMQSNPYNTTVYVGNISVQMDFDQICNLFDRFGQIVDVRPQFQKGYAFVTLDTHENAAMAIHSLNGQHVHGKPIKCSWGRERVDYYDMYYQQGWYPYQYPPYPMYVAHQEPQ
ncbi:hypothetical protein EDD86DRAFT_200022 [Gorgonomyces haynaldii]|nr:hypothetical protein EDD86DRAFT_200022 [Gorgonomyces haynaldii]